MSILRFLRLLFSVRFFAAVSGLMLATQAFNYLWVRLSLFPTTGLSLRLQRIFSLRPAMAVFNPFTATAVDLQTLLSQGKLNSSDLVRVYLAEIEKNNGYLKAVIATTPRSLLEEKARHLDEERAQNKVRGPLHGIPILLKDNIATHPDLGLDTTAGSYALAGSRPERSATIVEKLIKAGMIILGKANLSEFAFYRSEGIPSAWSAVGGQGQSAYVRGGIRPDDSFSGHSNPGGSSSGSAVSVSAGMAPVSIGTETMGSLIMPADRAALFTIKPTVGITSREGLIPVSDLCDSAGPMAKCSRDVANLLDALVDPTKTKIPDGGYIAAATGSWKGLRVGLVKPEDWLHSPQVVKYEKAITDQMLRDWHATYRKLAGLVETVDVQLISRAEVFDSGAKDINKLFDRDFRSLFEAYLSTTTNSKVNSLQMLIDFNIKHADLELPPGYDNQKGLLRAMNSNMTREEYDEILTYIRKASRDNGIDKTLQQHNIDVIIGPADGPLHAIAAAAAYPVASLPLGYADFNGRPFGMTVVTTGHAEAKLVQVQSAWEATFPPRKPPPLFAERSTL